MDYAESDKALAALSEAGADLKGRLAARAAALQEQLVRQERTYGRWSEVGALQVAALAEMATQTTLLARHAGDGASSGASGMACLPEVLPQDTRLDIYRTLLDEALCA